MILVVTTESSHFRLLKIYLEQHGYAVAKAYDLDEARQKLATGRIRLVLADVRQPDPFTIVDLAGAQGVPSIMIATSRVEDTALIERIGRHNLDLFEVPMGLNPLHTQEKFDAKIRELLPAPATA